MENDNSYPWDRKVMACLTDQCGLRQMSLGVTDVTVVRRKAADVTRILHKTICFVYVFVRCVKKFSGDGGM